MSFTSDVTDPVKLGICRSALMIATFASHTGREPSPTRNRGGSAWCNAYTSAAVRLVAVASDVPCTSRPNGCALPVPSANATTSNRSLASAISAGTWLARLGASCQSSNDP